MNSYCDLNIGEATLEKKALELGFARVKAAKRIALNSPKDLKLLSGEKEVFSLEPKSVDLLKAALKRDGGIMLVNPYFLNNFWRDDGLVRSLKTASEASVCAFEIPVSYFLSSKFVFRARFIASTRSFLRRCLKFRAPFVFTSRALSEFELKSPRELIAIGVFHGLSYEQAAYAISLRPEKLLEELK